MQAGGDDPPRLTACAPAITSAAVPIYEYQCQKCKKQFEYMQSMSDAPKKKCEKCGGKLEKLISAAGFVLKGGGWYKDLYASSPGGGGGGDSDGGGDAGGGEAKAEKSEKKADKKPASKKKLSSKGK
jgi:putative FmdB family regulatory protein